MPLRYAGGMKLILKWLLSAAALLAVAYIYSSGVSVASFGAAMVAALVIGLLNMLVRPVLVVLTIPVTILTLGLFALVINALVFLLAGTLSQAIGLGLMVDSFMAAFWGAIIMAVVNWILGPITGLLSAR